MRCAGSGRAGWLLAPLVGAALVAGCAAGRGGPAIAHVYPANTAPGGLMLVDGHGFRSTDRVRLGDHFLASTTWVNDTLLTAVVPADLPAGSYKVGVQTVVGSHVSAQQMVHVDQAAGVGGRTAPAAEASPAPPELQREPAARPSVSATAVTTATGEAPIGTTHQAPPGNPNPGKGKKK